MENHAQAYELFCEHFDTYITISVYVQMLNSAGATRTAAIWEYTICEPDIIMGSHWQGGHAGFIAKHSEATNLDDGSPIMS